MKHYPIFNLEQVLSVLKGLFDKTIKQGYDNITIHTYTDQNGTPIYYKARLKNSDGKKHIRPFYYDTQSQRWQPKEPPFTDKKPLYLLHTLVGYDGTIWIFEGEQKADLMQSLGYCATTTGGATTINAHDLTPLQGKAGYVLWRDNDMAGLDWLDTMQSEIARIHGNNTPTVRAVDVDSLGLPEKGDIIDYLHGLTIEQMQEKLANLPILTEQETLSLLQSYRHGKQSATPPTTPPKASQQGETAGETYALEWGEPLPLSLMEHRNNPYPIQAFGDELKAVVTEIAHYTQTPLALVGHSVLGALSAIGQRQVNANFLGGASIPCSLFLITEFPSGQGKTQANNLANKGIYEWEQANYMEYEQAYAQWERLPAKDKMTQPAPKNNAFILGDATAEAVADKFVLDGQKNLYWTTDEAGQFFNGYSFKSDTAGSNIGGILQAYDSGKFSKLRSGRGKTANARTHAFDCRLTLNLLGQRVVIEQAISNPLLVNQGFLPRSLLVCPKPNQGYRVFNTPERLAMNYTDSFILNNYYNKQKRLLAGEPKQRQTIWLDEMGLQALANYMQEVELLQRHGKRYANYVAFASRMGENTARIACLFAFWENSDKVTAQHIERARLLVDYSTNELLTYHDISDTEQSQSQKLNDWLVRTANKDKSDYVGYAHTQRNVSPKDLRDAKILGETLEHLQETNRVQVIQDGLKRLIKINPKLLNN